MPSSPRAGLGSRLAASVALAVGVLGVSAGCQTFRPPAPSDAHDSAGRGEAVHRGASPAIPPVSTNAPPGKYATRRGYCVFYHDFDLDRTDPLFAELEELPDHVFGELGLPPTTGVVQVFLFDTQDRYERYMRTRYPSLPTRRAYMITEPRAGAGDEVKVFTWMGDHLRTDLRHELTHALLRGVLKDVPLWLDEGLAGFFELPPEQDGVNPQHVEVLRRGPFKPDLGRLERLTEVAEMQKPEYREAWAWVHLMLRGSPEAKQVLREYLQALRTTAKPGPLLPRLQAVVGDPNDALFHHLAAVQMPRHRAVAPR